MANLSRLLLPSSSRSQVLSLIRSFCSSSSSSSPSAPIIKPVSYAPKPKDSNEDPNLQSQSQSQPDNGNQDTRTNLTREDIRFVKDAPSISPVSYSSRVARLPEDRAREVRDENELRREERRIETGRVRLNRFGLQQQEEENLPFPVLIKQEKQPQMMAMDLSQAIRDVKANAKAHFVETVEAHVNLGIDPRRGDQNVRGSLVLPHGTGKTVRVAVFAEGAAADDAREAGADVVGGDELIEEIKNGGGKLNFDKCIATPAFMPRLSKHIARILGPRGLMPNPKLGSVTSDVVPAVKAAKCGRIDFKNDKTANVHVGLGKANFSEEVLRENIGAFVNALLAAKPAGLKKTSKYIGYVKKFTLSSTMGPGYPITITSLSNAADHYNKLHTK